MIDSSYIWIAVFVSGAIFSREIWLHVQIARLSRDIAWIKRLLIDNNKEKGGEG